MVLITSSIHSTEVGGFMTPLMLADRLARAATPEARQILANSIIMLVPSQNPDGVDIVGDHYRATLGTPTEGTGPADLYHYYTGHDNNRDWYAFTQVETRYTIEGIEWLTDADKKMIFEDNARKLFNLKVPEAASV